MRLQGSANGVVEGDKYRKEDGQKLGGVEKLGDIDITSLGW